MGLDSYEVIISHMFYTGAQEALNAMKDSTLHDKHLHHAKQLHLIVMDMIQSHLRYEARTYYAPLLRKNHPAMDSEKDLVNRIRWTDDVASDLRNLCEATNINLDALVEVYKLKLGWNCGPVEFYNMDHFKEKPTLTPEKVADAVTELFWKTPKNVILARQFRKTVMANYFAYEIDTRLAAQLTGLFQHMRKDFKVIRIAKDIIEKVRYKVNTSELQLLLPVWKGHLDRYDQAAKQVVIY